MTDELTAYGNNLIKLGKLIKKPSAKMSDIVAAALDCGLIVRFSLQPNDADYTDVYIDTNEVQKALDEGLDAEDLEKVKRCKK